MIVCHCHQVTDREIRKAVDRGAHTLEAIEADCGAGSGCGGCTSEITALLFERRRVLPLVRDFMRGDLEVAS